MRPISIRGAVLIMATTVVGHNADNHNVHIDLQLRAFAAGEDVCSAATNTAFGSIAP